MGGIPVLSDLLETTKWLIDFFVNKVPRPVLFLIFILFITIVGLLMSTMMHLVGIHCNSNKEVVKTDTLDFYNNARIIFASTDSLTAVSYSLEDLYPDRTFSDVIFYAKLNTSLGIYVPCSENDTGCYYYLRNGACYNCTYGDVCIAKYAFICGDYEQICKSDAYSMDKGAVANKAGCLLDSFIKIPYHFIWNITSGQFECQNLTLCGPNATQTATQLDDLLQSLNVRAYYGNEPAGGINRMASITCLGLSPTLSFFGLPILDYRVWVLISVIYVMFMLLTHYGQQSRL